MALTKDEAQLVSVYRAIVEFEKPSLVDTEEVGSVLEALRTVVDLDKKENDLSGAELKILIEGFVAGWGATNLSAVLQQMAREQAYAAQSQEEETHFTGGPSGGTAVGQGSDPRYVAQSGVHGEDSN